MKKLFIFTFIILVFESCATRNGYLKFDSDLPDMEPKVFAKNIIGKDSMYIGYCSFNETGTEFYFAVTDKDWNFSRIFKVSANKRQKIDTLFFVNNKWEGEPCINYNGDKMFFTAILPPKENQPWQSNFYYVDKTDSGWSNPYLIKEP